MDDTAEHDYGHAEAIDAEAIGRPGQRRFRLLVRSATSTAAVWMEKQQIAGIGLWLEEALDRIDRQDRTNEANVEPEPFAEIFDLTFRAGQISLGYVERTNLFAIQAMDLDQASNRPRSTFRCLLGRGQARVLSRKIADLVAAGRPICPLCEQPMDPDGHTCPRSNGHSLTALN